MFSKLCDDNNETYNHLLLHTEVRWLSKGNFQARFINCILQFWICLDNRCWVKLYGELNNIKYDLAYVSDIFEHFNINNTYLQGYYIIFI